jgi:hypothetical protein
MRVRAHLLLVLACACGHDAPRSRDDAAPAPVPGALDADAVQRADACLHAKDPWAGACQALYREPLCQDAWAGVTTDPETVARMAAQCAIAYCPLLPKPRPWACTHPYRAPMEGWPELDRAILTYELGAVVSAPVIARIHPELVRPRSNEVEIDVEADYVVVDGIVYADDAFADAMRALPPDAIVQVGAPSSIPYARVVQVLGVLQAAGVKAAMQVK